MLEKIWYELSPIIYSAASCFVIFYTNFVGAVFAFLLLGVSLLIGVMRIQFRSTPKVAARARKSKATYSNYRV
jgi:large-conductance mechanosensitive channel